MPVLFVFSCSSLFFLLYAIDLSQCSSHRRLPVSCQMHNATSFFWLKLCSIWISAVESAADGVFQQVWPGVLTSTAVNSSTKRKIAFHGSIHTGFRMLLSCWAWQADAAHSDILSAQYLCRATRALWRSWQRPWCGLSLRCQAMSCLALQHSKIDWGCALLTSGVQSLLVFLFLVEDFC